MKPRSLILASVMVVAIAGPTVIYLLFPGLQVMGIGNMVFCWGIVWALIVSVLYNFLYPSPAQRYSDYDPSVGITIHTNSSQIVLTRGTLAVVLSITGDKELYIGDKDQNGSYLTSDGRRDYADLMAGMFKIAKVEKGYRVTWPEHKQPWSLS